MKTLLTFITFILSLVICKAEFSAEGIFFKIKEELFSRDIESISKPIPAEKMLQKLQIVTFSPDHVIFPVFNNKIADYRKSVSIELGKQIKAGDLYGHYRIIKYKDGTYAALYHHGDFGENQYYPCFCKLVDNFYEILGTICISGVSPEDVDSKKRERILVLKIPPEN